MLNATLSSADYTSFRSLKTFETVDMMNKSVRSFLFRHKHDLTDSTFKTLQAVSRYACKFFGVAFPRIITLQGIVGCSRRTILRALKELESLGIIKRYKTIRRRGGYGHPVIVIQPQDIIDLPDNDTSNVTSSMSHRESTKNPNLPSDEPIKNDAETKSFKTKSLRVKDINKRKGDPDHGSDFVAHWVPKDFTKTAALAFDRAKDIEECWRVVKQQSLKMRITNESDILMYADVAIKALICKLKNNSNKIMNPFGYLNRILCNIINHSVKNSVNVTVSNIKMNKRVAKEPKWFSDGEKQPKREATQAEIKELEDLFAGI